MSIELAKPASELNTPTTRPTPCAQVCYRNRYKQNQPGAPSVNRFVLCFATAWCCKWAQSCSLFADVGGEPKFCPCECTNRFKSDSSYSERFEIDCSVTLKALSKRLLLNDFSGRSYWSLVFHSVRSSIISGKFASCQLHGIKTGSGNERN